LGLQDKFYLGNLDAKRDWGHVKDYARMMWMILQADEAEDQYYNRNYHTGT
jgi:GDPmannose 4,6-dehydratase